MQSSPPRFTRKARMASATASTISRAQANTFPRLVMVDTSPRPATGIPVDQLEGFMEEWLGDGEYRECSSKTLELNRMIVRNLVWFVRDRAYSSVGIAELRQFFLYVRTGHSTDPRGRWGLGYCRHDPSSTTCVVTDRKLRCVIQGICRQAPSSRTVKDYFTRSRTFFRWMKKQKYIQDCPFDTLEAPIDRSDQLQPFNPDHVDALFAAAKKTQNPVRDETILWLLYDTGIRNTELCTLTRADLDMKSRDKSIRVLGKGNKRRSIYLGKSMVQQMWKYLRHFDIDDNQPLFMHLTGRNKQGPLTKDSLDSLFERLEDLAMITGIRCSPHTMRHTSAIDFLRAGGTLAELMERLGHTNMSMSRRYVAFAEADIARQSRFSPADARSRKLRR